MGLFLTEKQRNGEKNVIFLCDLCVLSGKSSYFMKTPYQSHYFFAIVLILKWQKLRDFKICGIINENKYLQ